METLPKHFVTSCHDSMGDETLIEMYLQDKSRPPLFVPGPVGCPSGLQSPPGFSIHHETSWSSSSHTSTEICALSPPAESDTMYEGTQNPTTPRYSEPSPSHLGPLPSQPWDAQHLQHAQFSLAHNLGSVYSTPFDISGDSFPGKGNDGSMISPYSQSLYIPIADSAIDPDLLQSGTHTETTKFNSVRPFDNSSTETAVEVQAAEQRSQGRRTRKPQRLRRRTKSMSRAVNQISRQLMSNPGDAQQALPVAQGSGPCETCGETFSDSNFLQRHIRSFHRRPFTCVFHYAGCSSTFGAKNEWKRHVLSQHLGLYYWHCALDHCSQTNPLHAHGRAPAPGIPCHGSIFNRKDLYTQHVRRMHLGIDGNKSKDPAIEERLKELQRAAKTQRCELPLHMKCPALGCVTEFNGANAWDERMEHVACHLGQAASGNEADVVFGGDQDPTLTNWAASPDVGVAVPLPDGGWQYRNPLKGTGGENGSTIPTRWRPDAGGEDAEGELNI